MTNLINFTGEAGQKPSGLFAVISSLLYIIYVVRRMTLCAITTNRACEAQQQLCDQYPTTT